MNNLQVSGAVCKRVLLTTPKRLCTYPPDSMKVLRDEKKEEFYIQLEGGRAFIKYKKLNGTIELTHTEVPKKFSGKGLAGILAKGTFDLIKEEKLAMKLSCEYLQAYYKKNQSKELTDLLTPEQKNGF